MRLNDVEHWLNEEEREILNNIVDADANRHYAAILHIASRLGVVELIELMESLEASPLGHGPNSRNLAPLHRKGTDMEITNLDLEWRYSPFVKDASVEMTVTRADGKVAQFLYAHYDYEGISAVVRMACEGTLMDDLFVERESAYRPGGREGNGA